MFDAAFFEQTIEKTSPTPNTADTRELCRIGVVPLDPEEGGHGDLGDQHGARQPQVQRGGAGRGSGRGADAGSTGAEEKIIVQSDPLNGPQFWPAKFEPISKLNHYPTSTVVH